MELINGTRMQAGYTMALGPDGRELLVIVVKGTFGIPKNGEPMRLVDEQVPLVMADTFTGEPGLSAPVHEVDFAPRKGRCDVLVVASAHAPGGRPASRVQAGIRVGSMSKMLAVVGNRQWQTGVSGVRASAPEPFTVMPISYDRAFGGVDARHDDPAQHAAFIRNPVGRGFHRHLRREWVDGSPLPNTEEPGRAVERPDSMEYQPMALGPVGRGWEQRVRFAGTYDDAWLEERFPFLPADFDERYYQAAPLDQQVPHPRGGEDIVLVNLSPEGTVGFTLPVFDAPVQVFPKQGKREDGALTLDTIVLEPDRGICQLSWRATRPLKKNMFEVAQVLVGRKGREWWQQRQAVAYPLVLVPIGGPDANGEDSAS